MVLFIGDALNAIGNWVQDVIRSIFAMLDGVIYGLAELIYDLIITIANTTIFTEEIFQSFESRVYALLGIFMLFKVSFSVLTYIINPDEFSDKGKGFSKLVSNIVITLILLVATPWIFNQTMELQKIILEDDIIERIFTQDSNNENVTYEEVEGGSISFSVFSAFYHFDFESYPACDGVFINMFNGGTGSSTTPEIPGQSISGGSTSSSSSGSGGDCMTALGFDPENETDVSDYNRFVDMHNMAVSSRDVELYTSPVLFYSTNPTDGAFYMDYSLLVSTAFGIILCLLFAVLAFDVGLRAIKLGFFQIIAPIPIISRLDPKKGNEVFSKWLKLFISTYLDLFIRLIGIYFASFMIANLNLTSANDASTGESISFNPLVNVFLILGLFMFAKQLPDIIKNITGLDLGGKMTLNPLKKLSEVPLIGKKSSELTGKGLKTAGNFTKSSIGAGIAKTEAGKELGKMKTFYGDMNRARKDKFNKSDIGRRMSGRPGDAFDKDIAAYEKISKANADLNSQLEKEVTKNKFNDFDDVSNLNHLRENLKAGAVSRADAKSLIVNDSLDKLKDKWNKKEISRTQYEKEKNKIEDEAEEMFKNITDSDILARTATMLDKQHYDAMTKAKENLLERVRNKTYNAASVAQAFDDLATAVDETKNMKVKYTGKIETVADAKAAGDVSDRAVVDIKTSQPYKLGKAEQEALQKKQQAKKASSSK